MAAPKYHNTEGTSNTETKVGKGGVAGPDAPKIQALPEWGGGLTLAWIFVKDLSTCTEGPQR